MPPFLHHPRRAVLSGLSKAGSLLWFWLAPYRFIWSDSWYGCLGAGIRFPPRNGTGHRASQGPGLRSALLPSEPHLPQKSGGSLAGGEEREGLPRVIPNKMLETDEVKRLRGVAHFRFARVARGGGPESKLPRETWGWASDSGSNGRLRVKDQGSQWEVRGAGPSWDHTQVIWGHIGAGVLG